MAARLYSRAGRQRQENRAKFSLARRSPALPRLGLKRRDAGLQRLVLLARQPGHFLAGLEDLAANRVELIEDTLGLGAEQGAELAAYPLGNAGGVVHEPRHLVEKPIVGLGHRNSPNGSVALGQTMAMATGCRKGRPG